MDINTFAEEAYHNAKEHGLWDNVEPGTVACLIHAEWSEALSEARAGMPMIYHNCKGYETERHTKWDPCEGDDKSNCYYRVNNLSCPMKMAKPEGIAVELIDGIILICSASKHYKQEFDGDTDMEKGIAHNMYPYITKESPICDLICELHLLTANFYRNYSLFKDVEYERVRFSHLETAVGLAWLWIELQGLNPEEILMEKHKYNKTREYKHGKEF